MSFDWDAFHPEWARGLKDELPEDLSGIYVSHDPADEAGKAPTQEARVLALSRSGLYACRLEAHVRTDQWATYPVRIT